MKYTYAYKTPDGVRHEAAMEAGSREEVFERLRKSGIKAIKVVAEDGSKANGEGAAAGRRRYIGGALAAALVAVVAGVAAYLAGSMNTARDVAADADAGLYSPRHQIYGDPATMEELEKGGFAKVFPRMGDQLIAWFAQPGRVMCPSGVDPRRLAPATYELLEKFASSELSAKQDIAIAPEDPREIRELKQIVNGMRREMRGYLANGNGTPRSYWRRLNERTTREMQIYERTRREMEKESSEEVREQRNDQLRRLGLRTIPSPAESTD